MAMKSALLLTPFPLLLLATSAAAQVTVCSSGCDASTIQAGIVLAPSPGTVTVLQAGATTYFENVDFLGKEVVLSVAPGAGPVTLSPVNFTLPIVSFTSGEGRGAVLRGFTLTGATDAPAVLCDGSAPTLEGNRIEGNGSATVAVGAGVTALSSGPLLLGNQILQNTAGSQGGGVFATGSAAGTGGFLELEGNLISGNKAQYQGAGLALVAVDAARIEDNEFDGNDVGQAWPVHCDSGAAPGGGAIAVIDTGGFPVSLTNNEFGSNHSWQFGGAVLCVGSSPSITASGEVSFDYNVAECNGGGIAMMHGSSPAVEGYLFSRCYGSVNGGGVAAIFSSNGIIRNCEFNDCVCLGVDDPDGTTRDAYGGGIYVEDAAPLVVNSVITECIAEGGDDAYGGGVAVVDGANGGDCSVRVRGCELTFNGAHTAGAGIFVGKRGVAFGPVGQRITIRNNHIAENGTYDFLAEEPFVGGGIAVIDADAEIERNTLLRNRASLSGAGIHAENLGELSELNSNMVIKNELRDADGPTLGMGAGIWVSGDIPRLIHNTVARNEGAAGTSGAGIFVVAGGAEIWNTIVWNNAGATDIDGDPTVYYSDVDKPGGWASGGGTFRRYPRFVNPAADDFHLDISSPCINRGSVLVSGMSVLDIDGEARVLDGATEMGADERDQPNPIGVQ